jgi:hypothetical protein
MTVPMLEAELAEIERYLEHAPGASPAWLVRKARALVVEVHRLRRIEAAAGAVYDADSVGYDQRATEALGRALGCVGDEVPR